MFHIPLERSGGVTLLTFEDFSCVLITFVYNFLVYSLIHTHPKTICSQIQVNFIFSLHLLMETSIVLAQFWGWLLLIVSVLFLVR
jgi:hypothetical protein